MKFRDLRVTRFVFARIQGPRGVRLSGAGRERNCRAAWIWQNAHPTRLERVAFQTFSAHPAAKKRASGRGIREHLKAGEAEKESGIRAPR